MKSFEKKCRDCGGHYIGGRQRWYCNSCLAQHRAESSDRWRKANPEQYRAINTKRFRNWRRKHPVEAKRRQKNLNLKRMYGISLEKYQAIINSQNNQCKLCGINFDTLSPKFIHVDHDHISGKVRSILCHHCNTGLGAFKEDVALLEDAIKYLESFL